MPPSRSRRRAKARMLIAREHLVKQYRRQERVRKKAIAKLTEEELGVLGYDANGRHIDKMW